MVPLARGVIKPRDLAAAVSKMLVEAQAKQPVFKTVQNDEISITDKMSWIVRYLAAQPVAFEALVVVKTDRDEIVTTFLAVLELMKDRKIICEQADYDASIMVRLKEGTKELRLRKLRNLFISMNRQSASY